MDSDSETVVYVPAGPTRFHRSRSDIPDRVQHWVWHHVATGAGGMLGSLAMLNVVAIVLHFKGQNIFFQLSDFVVSLASWPAITCMMLTLAIEPSPGVLLANKICSVASAVILTVGAVVYAQAKDKNMYRTIELLASLVFMVPAWVWPWMLPHQHKDSVRAWIPVYHKNYDANGWHEHGVPSARFAGRQLYY